MRPLVIFILVIVFTLFCGTLLAYPLYDFASLFYDASFSDIATLATQLSGLFFSLVYLELSDTLNFNSLGFPAKSDQNFLCFTRGFLAGLIIILLLITILTVMGVYGFNFGQDTTIKKLALLLLGAIITGVTVSLFEEIIFRGALLQGLSKKVTPSLAIFATSAVYAYVHFISFTEPKIDETTNFFTIISQFYFTYSTSINIENYDAFLSLFILGLLLGLIRVRTKSILQCIAMHAGLVAGIKLFRFFMEYKPGTQFDFLVSNFDHRLGFMAMILLSIATTIYYFFYFKEKIPSKIH